MATLADRIVYPWLRVRKFGRHASIRLRRTNKRLAAALGPARARAQAVAAQVRERFEALRYRIPGERDSCPACDSSQVRLVDVLPMRRDVDGKRIGFLAGCESCGLLFANPMPSSAELDAFYAPEGHWSVSQEEAHGLRPKEAAGDGEPPPKRRRAIVFEALHAHINVLAPSAGSKVLDFGCGNGKFLNALQDYKWETYGIEPSTRVAFTRHRELVEPPLEPTFDLVVLNHVLEHIENPLHVLERLARRGYHRNHARGTVTVIDRLAPVRLRAAMADAARKAARERRLWQT